jgi:hypothetical protein
MAAMIKNPELHALAMTNPNHTLKYINDQPKLNILY